jgi:hypothetical protein
MPGTSELGEHSQVAFKLTVVMSKIAGTPWLA